MNEKIFNRLDRKNRFGDLMPRSGMDSCKLGGRHLSQFDRLLLCLMEPVYNFILGGKHDDCTEIRH